MKGPDLDRERSEKRLTLTQFLETYNEGLPLQFPRASLPLLKIFTQKYPELFKSGNDWSLDQHRKRVMDWLPMHMRTNPDAE